MQVFLRGNPVAAALTAALAAVVLLTLTMSLAEPVVSHGATDTFTVTQEVTSEISFLSPATDVVMDTALTGITADNSRGTTTFNVTTNNSSGYTVTIAFSSTTAMNSTSSPNLHINNYIPGDNPSGDWDMSVSSGQHFFAYTAANVTTPSETASTFLGNGTTACTSGSTATPDKCWFNKADATAAETIIDASADTAATGATSTVTFQVQFGSNSGVANGWYVATATLTAAVK